MSPATTEKPIEGKSLAWLLTLVYFTSYMTRKNFAVVLQQVIADTGLAKEALSVVLVCMTVTYGVGQIINGRLGDKFKPTNLIFCGLILSTAVNLLFPFLSGSIPVMAIAWGINGFAQAMMWPPIVKILVINCDDAMYGYSVVRISWGSSFATIALYLAAPILIRLTGSWKAIFFVSAAIGLAMTISWWFAKRRVNVSLPTEAPTDGACASDAHKARFRIPHAAVLPLIFIIFGVIFQGMLRDGVATWMPSYLSEVHGMDNAGAILSGVFPAVFSVVTFGIAGALYKKFFRNEVLCGGVIFGVAVIASLTLLLLFGKSTVVAILCLTLVTGCMHGVNLMLITHVPKRFKRYGNIATFSGVINACVYIGEALFTYGLAMFSDRFGWHVSIAVILAIAVLGTLSCLLAARPWQTFYDKTE